MPVRGASLLGKAGGRKKRRRGSAGNNSSGSPHSEISEHREAGGANLLLSADERFAPRSRGIFYSRTRANLFAEREGIKNERHGSAGKCFIWLPPILRSASAAKRAELISYSPLEETINFDRFLFLLKTN